MRQIDEELPPDFPPSPMTRRLASQHGVTDDELVAGDWPTGLIHGVRSWEGVDKANPWLRIQQVMSVFPVDAAITGWAGAWAHGARWLTGLAPGGRGFLPIPLALQPHLQTRRRTGLRILRSEFSQDEVCMIDEIPTLSPLRCTYDGIRTSPLTEGVVLLDAMLHFGLVTKQELADYVRAHPRGLGNPVVRKALDLADGRVLSPQESRTRMLWVIDAGLPPPEVNIPVYDESGTYLGKPDLLDTEAGVAVEYDGSHHAELAQRTFDHGRREDFEVRGLIVITLTSLSLTTGRKPTITRFRSLRRQGLARDRSFDRWRVYLHDRGVLGY